MTKNPLRDVDELFGENVKTNYQGLDFKIKEKASRKKILDMALEYVNLWLNKEMQEYVEYPKKHPEIKKYIPYIKKRLKVFEEHLEIYEKNNDNVWEIKKIHNLMIEVFKSIFNKNFPYLIKANTYKK